MIKITVPATSANLGIGYDTLGMAVSLYAHFSFARAEALEISGCPEEFQNEHNLVYASFANALRAWGAEPFPVRLHIETDVPVARGLGSSSTCVVAGIMAAAALTRRTVDRAELVRLATEVEGHPDNVAPAILGGAVCSFTPSDGEPRCLRYEVSRKLRFVTIIPPYEVHTHEARQVVPAQVPLADAVWQMGRVAGMTRGLETGDLALIAAANATGCRSRTGARSSPITTPSARRAWTAGRARLWISGSGSTLTGRDRRHRSLRSSCRSAARAVPHCATRILTVRHRGPRQIEYSRKGARARGCHARAAGMATRRKGIALPPTPVTKLRRQRTLRHEQLGPSPGPPRCWL